MSGEINLQSKQDIICHVAKVKPATSTHYGANVIPLLASIKPEKMYFTHSKDKIIWKLAWDMPMNDRLGNEYHTINNTIDKQPLSLKVKIYFLCYD